MPRERAKTFADRLPPLVPRQETDISHLSDEMADILYPGRRPRPFRIAVEFDPFEGPAGERARALAEHASDRRETADRIRAGFTTQEADALHELYQLVGARAGTDVLVDGKAVPYAVELWLPMFWLFRGAQA